MNTEDRLRRASQEMDRATATLTPPPIGDVRRSARMRSVGVAAAAAVGVIVLVGGVVLALRPVDENTLGPSGPGETATTTTTTTATDALDAIPDEIYGHPVRVPGLDPEPGWRPYEDAVEVALVVPDDVSSELFRAARAISANYEDDLDEVLVLGELFGYQSFVFRGELVPRDPVEGEADEYARCLVLLEPDGSTLMACSAEATSADGWLTPIRREDGVFGVVGVVPSEATTVVLEIDDTRLWSRTREGYVNLFGQGLSDSAVTYRFFDHIGTELSNGAIRPIGVDAGPTTTATAAPDPGCSAGDISPSALALSSVPQPVAQSLVDIVEAAQICDFDRLAAVGGDDFTASFGGGDPAELWAYEEGLGLGPMYWLLCVLGLPHGTVDLGDELMYVWPAAATHDGGWDTMPEQYLEPLRAIYSEDNFEDFRQFGDYIGYRVGITESGDWSFFVAGD